MKKNQVTFESIVSEKQSPLFRIMWVFGSQMPSRRHFDNNIIAFHIGSGYILSVAHNLRTECGLIRSMPEQVFVENLLPLLSESQQAHVSRCYRLDSKSGERYLDLNDQSLVPGLIETIKSSGFDTRWVSLAESEICKPHLIVQFKEPSFFGSESVAASFAPHNRFYEEHIERHTFLLELDLVDAFYGSDIALYRVKPELLSVAELMPKVEPDFNVIEGSDTEFYCLQSSPGGFLGRLLNRAQLEGYLDQHQVSYDRLGGNYILEGFRYLIRGYFRFGSSGAPYLVYDAKEGRFKANAIQSEASPVQLSINNSREGNFQYVNAIASPLRLIESRLKELL